MAKRICAWCKLIMGECSGEFDTHTICPECYKKMKADMLRNGEEIKKKMEA